MIEELALAQDPQTPPELLTRLVQSPNEEIARAAMRNPNLPRETLFQFAASYPGEFAQNPALPLILLEDTPKQALTLQALLALIEHDVPEELLRLLLSAAPLDIQRQIVPRISSEKVLSWLAKSDAGIVRAYVALNANTSPATLSDLSADPMMPVRKEVARNRRTPPEILESLSKETHNQILLPIAAHPNTNLATIERLIALNRPRIRRSLATNPNTPLPVLVRLVDASFFQEETPREVAQHPAASAELLERLSHANDWRIREQVAINPKTPTTTRERLCKDPDPEVREAARRKLTAE
jgi:hypothetical protein